MNPGNFWSVTNLRHLFPLSQVMLARNETLHRPAEQLDVDMTQQLEVAVAGLEQISSILPGGYALVAAVCDLNGDASDLFVRDQHGETSVVLGLPEEYRREIGRLLTLARGEDELDVRRRRRWEQTGSTAAVALTRDHRYREIVEQCPVPLVSLRNDGTIEYISPAVAPTLGLEPSAQLTGRSWLEFVHPEDRARVISIERLSFGAAADSTLVLRLRRADGSYVRVETMLRSVTGVDGEFGGAILALRETSGSRSGFEEMLVAERRQRALANAADCGTALLVLSERARGTVLEANPAFGRIMGAPAGQMVGHSIIDLVSRPDSPRTREALRSVAATGQPRRLEVRLASSPRRQTEFVIATDLDSGDPPTQLTVRVRDITEQRGFVAELTRTVERLEQLNGELAEFARVMAHDLAAPLRALSGLLDLLAPAARDAELTATMEAIRSAITRMQGMLDGVIGYAQTQDAEPRQAQVDLNVILDHVLETLRPEIDESFAVITAAVLPTVLGDPHQLERLLLNLVGNALKYGGDEPPHVRVDGVYEGDHWRITVADQGVGVEPEAAQRIFKLFERAAAGRSMRADTGRGIGLATCRRIVELHGGRIWVEPNRPRGSIFQFTLGDDQANGVS